jgi:hypothetical protein
MTGQQLHRQPGAFLKKGGRRYEKMFNYCHDHGYGDVLVSRR